MEQLTELEKVLQNYLKGANAEGHISRREGKNKATARLDRIIKKKPIKTRMDADKVGDHFSSLNQKTTRTHPEYNSAVKKLDKKAIYKEDTGMTILDELSRGYLTSVVKGAGHQPNRKDVKMKALARIDSLNKTSSKDSQETLTKKFNSRMAVARPTNDALDNDTFKKTASTLNKKKIYKEETTMEETEVDRIVAYIVEQEGITTHTIIPFLYEQVMRLDEIDRNRMDKTISQANRQAERENKYGGQMNADGKVHLKPSKRGKNFARKLARIQARENG